MSEHLLDEGVSALRRGDRRRARRLLGQVVATEPDNAAAWWFLAAVLDDTEQRAECLRQVLRLRPDHTEARELLTVLERRIGQVTPPEGVERPVLDVLENTRGDLVVVPDEPEEPEAAPDEEPASRDVRVAAAAILVALAAILVTVVLISTGAAPVFLGARGADLEPTDRPLAFGVPACAATGEDATLVVFINNSGVIVDIYRGTLDSGTLLLTLGPGAQDGVDAQPGQLVRYAVDTQAEGMAGSSALIEVPRGSMCRVPVQ